MKVYLAKVKDISLIDYPGYPCIVIWFQGCNFRCHYCYNYELWEMEKVIPTNIEEVIKRIAEVNKLIDACKITGGEPTIQSEALKYIGKKCKKMNLKFGIDTNGTNPKLIEELIENSIIDHIAIDLKAPLNVNSYKRVVGINVTGKEIEEIKKTIKLAFEYELESVEIRIPIIRELNNDVNSIMKIRENLIDLGYLNAVNNGRMVSIEILEVIHSIAANEKLRLKDDLNAKEILELSELIDLPKVYIRHKDIGFRVNLREAKSIIEKFKF